MMENTTDELSSSMTLVDEQMQTLYHYFLWSSKLDEDYTIEAVFGQAVKTEFYPCDQFGSSTDVGAVVYRLPQEIPVSLTRNVHTSHNSQSYQIRITSKTSGSSKQMDDVKTRHIDPRIDQQFLFDVHFQSHGPFRTTMKDSLIPVWLQLCFYTYFLIKQNQNEKYDAFLEQFKTHLSFDQNRHLTRDDLRRFYSICSSYFPQIAPNLKSNPTSTLAVLLRMFGTLPIDTKNIIVDDPTLHSLLAEIYDYLRQHLHSIIEKYQGHEITLITKGLIHLMSIPLLSEKQITFNTLFLLDRLNEHPNRKNDIVNQLLRRLIDLRVMVRSKDWPQLLQMTKDQTLFVELLDINSSFNDYLIALDQLTRHNNVAQISKKLVEHLDKFMGRSKMNLTFEDIHTLLNILKPHEKQAMRNIIKGSDVLRLKLKHIMNNLDVSAEHLETFQELFDLDHSLNLLDIDKTQYLIDILNKSNNRNKQFYSDWFLYFLVDRNYQPTHPEHQKHFQRLLDAWCQQITAQPKFFIEFIDRLSECVDHLKSMNKGNDDHRLKEFTDKIIEAFFKTQMIYEIIVEVSRSNFDRQFLTAFQHEFIRTIINTNNDILKMMTNPKNPLCRLLECSQSIDPTKDTLLKSLIKSCTVQIKLLREDIRQDVFFRPNDQSCCYKLLFDPRLNDPNLSKVIIQELDLLWTSWIHIGLTLADIRVWKSYSHEEYGIFHKIWSHVEKVTRKTEPIEKLFVQTQNDLRDKERTLEALCSCLNLYCSRANDVNENMNHVTEVLESLRCLPICAVNVPEPLQPMVQLSKTLFSFANSKVWKHIYKRSACELKYDQQIEEQLQILSRSNESLQLSRKDSKSRNNSASAVDGLTTSISRIHQPLTSLKCLNDVYDIFDNFCYDLTQMYNQWKSKPVEAWILLFDQIDDIHHEIRIFEEYLNRTTPEALVDILSLWKKIDEVHHICQGCLNLSKELNIEIPDEDKDLLIKLINFDTKIRGETCHNLYQSYHQLYESKYSADTLIILSQYSIAGEFMEFIKTRSRDDFDHLLETVNDWDTQLVSAKTVLDFASFKHYLTEVYDLISHSTMTFYDVISCFNEVQVPRLSESLENFFHLCSSELSNMQESHEALTDKNKSKRRQIQSILDESSIQLFQDPNDKNRFDVQMEPQRLNFFELNQLRDRARLMQYSSFVKTKKSHEDSAEQLQIFIDLIHTIELILIQLKELYITGHSIIYRGSIFEDRYRCQNMKYDHLKQLHRTLENLLDDWRKCLDEQYRRFPELTLFSRDQYQIIEHYLSQTHKHLEEEPGYHLLQYLGIDPVTAVLEPLLIPDRDEERLKCLGQKLFPRQPSLKLDRSNKRIYVLPLAENNLLRAILTFNRKFDTKTRVRNLFFCTPEIDWLDVRAFIYRAFFSDEYYQLIRPEKLSVSIQDQLSSLLRALIDDNVEQSFRLGIIVDSDATNRLHFIHDLNALQIVEVIPNDALVDSNEFKRIVTETVQNVTIVTSAKSSLGKTQMIEDECRRIYKECLKFPISGTIDPDAIARRLLNRANQFTKSAIHFDMGMINNIQVFSDFISLLLFFRSYRFGQVAISIPAKTPIFVELDSSSHLLWDEHNPIFFHLRSISETRINPERFLVTESVLFVVNYLQMINAKTSPKKPISRQELQQLACDRCSSIIQKSFFPDRHFHELTWTQISICISIYENLFESFSKSPLSHENDSDSGYKKIRLEVLQHLIKSATMFTSTSSSGTKSNQIIRWDQTKPFTFVFSYDSVPIFVYKTKEDIPEGLRNYLLRLSHQFKSTSRPIKSEESSNVDDEDVPVNEDLLPDYSQFNHYQLFKKLTLLSLKYIRGAVCTRCFRSYEWKAVRCSKCPEDNSLLEKPSEQNSSSSVLETFHKRMAKAIQKEYVFTPDNFIKILLVYLRVQSKVPVLIMGETGCGKTALIRCLSEKILDHDLYIFRLHAGITDEFIINKMRDLINDAKRLPNGRQLWVFFDEFNTISNVSLLKEIICERTLLGEPIPENMVFLGTCNPPRKRTEQPTGNHNVGIKKKESDILRMSQYEQKYLYAVRMIPERMLEYVWDYGYLDRRTERTYIKASLKRLSACAENRVWFEVIADLISKSQEYVREREDVSSVSLRDIARYCRLYEFFDKYLLDRKDHLTNRIEQASLMALLLCYYYRLDSREHKRCFLKDLHQVLTSASPRIRRFHDNYLYELIDNEETHLLSRMDIPSDMAWNKALKENLFVTFCCTINRIPVFLCGKPGASKTSAVKILMNTLQGAQSRCAQFRQYPKLVAVNFQGSTNNTSKSIEEIFERAAKFQHEQATSSNILPVIIFDEIGLAELSEHNPLKVLHEQLEIETCRFGFIGISNWRLDAAKMNRALYVACTDPDRDELNDTSQHLFKTLYKANETCPLDTTIFSGLAEAYRGLQETMKGRFRYENYYGLRDFYALIKGVLYAVDANPTADVFNIIHRQLSINFGDLWQMHDYMWKTFCTLTNHHQMIQAYPTINRKELIDHSLDNRQGRHLMIIVEREHIIDHLEYRFLQQQSSVKILVGSQFDGDVIGKNIYSDAYSTRILMDIILQAETPMLLIMRQMNHLYDNLYDLFNETSTQTAQKKYCRIALSATYNPRCVIDNQFFCIIFLCKDEVQSSEPPFLSRFEKHFVKMADLMSVRQRIVASFISNKLNRLFLPGKNQQYPRLEHMILPYHEDFIYDLVMQYFNEEDSNESIADVCEDRLIRASSFDFGLALALANNRAFIEKYYQIHSQFINISQLISSTLEQPFMTKRIIYTFTPRYESIDYHPKDFICEKKLSSIKCELDLINFLTHSAKSLLEGSIVILHVDYHHEHQYIRSLKSNIYNHWPRSPRHHLWLLFHVERQRLVDDHQMVLFPHWDVLMIDDLNHQPSEIITKQCLQNPSYRDFLQEYPLDFLKEFYEEFVQRALEKVSIQATSETRNDLLLDALIQNADLRKTCQKNIQYAIEHYPNSCFQDWRKNLIENNSITASSRSFDEALKTTMMLFYDSYFRMFIYHWEQNNLFDSFFYFQDKTLNNIWYTMYEYSLSKMDPSIFNRSDIEVQYISNLKLPFAVKEFDVLTHLPKDCDDKNEFCEYLIERSTYGKSMIDEIMKNPTLFEWYYDDQLMIFHHTHQLIFSYSFLKLLVTANRERDIITRLMQLFVYTEEFIEILNIFEYATKVIGEAKLSTYLSQQTEENPTVNVTYSLIHSKFDFEFDPLGDPFLEVSLMNTIELLLSPEDIIKRGYFEETIALFSGIHASTRRLDHYRVINLEKLVSMMHLLRCIQNFTDSTTIKIFQEKSQNGFTFNTCEDIHHYLDRLKKYLGTKDKESIFLKLEIQFLQQWSIDHPDQALTILNFINQIETGLWKYSTDTITSIIDEYRLDVFIETDSEQPDETLDVLGNKLKLLAKDDYKIHRIIANRLLMDTLADKPIKNSTISKTLNEGFGYFQNSVETVHRFELNADLSPIQHVQLIRLMTFLKYYCQTYAHALSAKMKFPMSESISRYLIDNESPICSTLKLYTVKEILCRANLPISTLDRHPIFLHLTWLKQLRNYVEESQPAHAHSIVCPMPVDVPGNEFERVDQILKTGHEPKLRDLIEECGKKAPIAYSFYLWFIRYYHQHSSAHRRGVDQYKDLFQDTHPLSSVLKNAFSSLSIRFLHQLTTNFDGNSYFHLQPSTKASEHHIRLVALNIFAVALSYPKMNWLKSLLFQDDLSVPNSYYQHLQKRFLFGFLDENSKIIENMREVRNANNRGGILTIGKYIYRCSRQCLYVYSSINENKQCPFCRAQIARDQPKVRLSVADGLKLIEDHINRYEQIHRTGYYQVHDPNQSSEADTSAHLSRSGSFRFFHLVSHSILLLLSEMNYFTVSELQHWRIPSRTYFGDHVDTDYLLLGDCYVWLFHLCNRLFKDFTEPSSTLDSHGKVIELEQRLEKQLIIPSFSSRNDDIERYQREHAHFVKDDHSINQYLNERMEDPSHFPWLNFFNVTSSSLGNCIGDFTRSFQALPNVKDIYPLTHFILKNLDELSNIQQLDHLMKLINYLREKYTYRITREKAVGNSINQFLQEPNERKLSEEFFEAWAKITLTEVQSHGQTRRFDRTMTSDVSLAFFSLQKSDDDKGFLLRSTIQTLLGIQNNLIDYLRKTIHPTENLKFVSIDKIAVGDLFICDRDILSKKIVARAAVMNFDYGRSKTLVYDYEEIEMILQSMVIRLSRINVDELPEIQYQFEFYAKNSSLINHVRQYVEQKLFNEDQAGHYRRQLDQVDEHLLVQYLGTLNSIFAAMRHRNFRSSISTIQQFTQEYMRSTTFQKNNMLSQTPFGAIDLCYILHFYELIEELLFDRRFRKTIVDKLNSESIDDDDSSHFQDLFLRLISEPTRLATSLKNPSLWLATLKRFLVRISSDHIDWESPIEMYLKRSDLWSSRVSAADIETIHLDESIRVKHTYAILVGLEKHLDAEKMLDGNNILNETDETENSNTQKPKKNPVSQIRRRR